MTVPHLDSRAWLAWGIAAMFPPLLSRNPWVLIGILVIVLTVRATWVTGDTARRMGWFVRIAALFVMLGMAFNVLTVHAGDTVFTTLPEAWPIVGGGLTLNALVYGALSGMALFTLVLTGITVASLISWVDLFHALPPRLAPIAVTGSVAWSYLPQLAVTWQNIREAQMMRGHRLRGPRHVAPLVTPLLAASLERSLVMAEVLEARGFGAPPMTGPVPGSARTTSTRVAVSCGLIALAAGGYCLAVGLVGWGLAGVGAGVILTAVGIRASGKKGSRRTRLRPPRWTLRDSLVTMTAAIGGIVTVAWVAIAPEAASYQVYPELTLPAATPWVLLALALLLTPAFLAGKASPP